MPRIAIIEDDSKLNDHLKGLVESLPDAAVSQYLDRSAAEEAVIHEHFDLVILDIELGQGPKDKYGGLSILAKLSGKRTVTLVVSGTSEQSLPNIVITLQAYDFIGKPIDDLNFINKVEHALNSQRPDYLDDSQTNQAKVWPPGLTPDPERHPGFLWKGKRVRLTLTQVRLINCLIKNPGQPVGNQILAKQLESSNSPSAIATHMSDIRHRFTDIDPEFKAIDIDPGKGYVWLFES